MARFEFLGRFSRNRGALIGAGLILLVALTAVLAPLFFPTDPLRIVGAPELWPGEDPDFPLGTDSLGRDILARFCEGARISLAVGSLVAVVGAVIGGGVGPANARDQLNRAGDPRGLMLLLGSEAYAHPGGLQAAVAATVAAL